MTITTVNPAVIVQREMISLEKKKLEVQDRVSRLLEERFGRRMYRPAPKDALRLTALLVWEVRYKVPLEYITGVLVTYWSGRFRGKGLGCKVATLVGAKSRAIIEDAIGRDFPARENEQDWRIRLQARILQTIAQRGGDIPAYTRSRGLLEYDTPQEFVMRYRNRVSRKRNEFASAGELDHRQDRHYRNSPW